MTLIAVIDYGLGNISSIRSALEKSGSDVILTNNKKEIMECDGVVLPGVGAFPHGMARLRMLGLDSIILSFAKTDKPLLGICLGMQLFFESSSEFEQTTGLGLIKGTVNQLELKDKLYQKLPHVSWNEIQEGINWNGTILEGIQDREDLYFVHGFYAKPESEDTVLSTTTYSQFQYCSTVKYGNIYGCQYHPEKSAVAGLRIMRNFVNLCGG
jgi:glutamine amidotransferase